MSYCRWSSDGYRCDVYVYEHCNGRWMTHIAGRKKVGLDTLPPDPTTFLGQPGWEKLYRSWFEAYDKLEWKDHTLPYAGETFVDDTAAECADRLEELRKIGYYVPQYAIDELRRESNETH